MAGYVYRGTVFDAQLPATRKTWTRPDLRRVTACGTVAGYAAHRRAGDAPCESCREANATYCREHRQAKRAA